MKKLFRHVAGVIILSFVVCLFLPLQTQAGEPTTTEIFFTPVEDLENGYYSQRRFFCQGYDSSVSPVVFYYDTHDDSVPDARIQYFVSLSNTRLMFDLVTKRYVGTSPDDLHYRPNDDVVSSGGTFFFEDATGHRHYYLYGPSSTIDSLNSWTFNVALIPVSSIEELRSILLNDDISDFIPPNTDTYSLDKSLGLVKNARWKHLESKDKYNQVLQDAMNLGTGTGDPGNAFYSDIYTRYAEFVQDKCSFATISTTGIKIGGRYQLQYASRVGFTFAYNLPDLLEHTDFTKQFYKRFGSSKPYPIVNGTNFDANQNIQSLFVQAYQWNDTLPSVGNLKRSLIFKETKYWIDVRIIDTKTKTYGAWYAMDMINNTAKEVVTDDGDIDSDVSSEDDAGNYTKEEGEGDTFQDAEDNAKEVDHSTHYDQKWYDDVKDNTKKSAPAFKNLLSMITGIPSMIATLFSWLPSWVLELVSAFFALVVVLALLRFVLGS